jgi:hypothetical protein
VAVVRALLVPMVRTPQRQELMVKPAATVETAAMAATAGMVARADRPSAVVRALQGTAGAAVLAATLARRVTAVLVLPGMPSHRMVVMAVPVATPALRVRAGHPVARTARRGQQAPVPMAARVVAAVMARASHPVPVLAAPAVKAALAPLATAPQGPQVTPAAAADPEGMGARAVTEPVPRASEAKAATGVTAG